MTTSENRLHDKDMEEIFSIFGSNITTVVSENGCSLYKTKEVASLLGFERPGSAIRKHVQDEYKIRFCDIVGIDGHPIPRTEELGTIFITEPGIYELAFGSKLPVAKRFQDEVIQMLCRR